MPFATVSAAYDAIMKHFSDGWAAAYPTNAPPVYYPDQENDAPTDQTPWVQISFQHKRGFQATINSPGNRRFRKTGTIKVAIRTLRGDGLTVSQGYTDTVLGIFEGRTTGPDAVIFRDVLPSEAGADGAWFLSNVLVNFEYDQFR